MIARHHRTAHRRLAIAVLSATLPLAAHARLDAAGGTTLEEIIVTAQRTEQSANDVGMDIQAFQGEQIEKLRITSVEGLTAVVPGFTVAQSYQGVPTYTLRGIGFNTINMSSTSTVGTYVDEVAYPYPILNAGPMFDLERVEVLKGPQGTLFGRNTTAGLINLVTNKPSEELEAAVKAEAGDFATTNFEGMLSGPLGRALAGRIAVRTEDSQDGWQQSNARDEELGEVHRYGARLSLVWRPREDLQVDASYNGWLNRSDTLAAQAIGFTPSTTSGAPSVFNAPGIVDYVKANRPDEADQADWAPQSVRGVDAGTGLGLPGDLEEDSRMHAYKLHAQWDLSDAMRLVSLSGYQDLERKALTDFSGAPYEVLLQDIDGSIESFSQELRLEGESGNASWLLGAYYADDELVDGNRTLLGQNANVGLIRAYTAQLISNPVLGPLLNTGGYTVAEALQAFRTYEDHAEIDASSWSVFGNYSRELGNAFTLTTGIRYTEDQQDYGGCSRDFNGNMLPNVNVTNRALFLQSYGMLALPIAQGQCNTFDPLSGTFGLVESELDEDNVAWRMALDWSPADGLLVYASVSQGAKSGVTPVNAANIAAQNAPVKQEQLLAWELGVKSTLLDRRLQVNASTFYYDYEDKQLSVYFADPIYTTLSRLANIPDSAAWGLDSEVSWQATEHLLAIVSATLLHTEVQDYVGIDVAGKPKDYDGAEFLYSPDTSGAMSLLYDRPVASGLGLRMMLNGRYQSSSNANLDGNMGHEIDSYALLNASIGIHALDERWDVSLWGANLTDEYYWLTVTQNANTVIRFPGKTRTWGATLSYRLR